MGLSLAAAAPAAASATTWYVYATATTSGLTSCPQTAAAAQQCTLAEGLSLASPGDTVALATAGTTAHYVGNWLLPTLGTSALLPVSIAPAAGVSNPTLDGNGGAATGCQTPGCNGPVLAIGGGMYADITGVTFQGADDVTGSGGAIYNAGTLTVSASTFSNNMALNGGAIYDKGTLIISGTTFTNDSATSIGGAIEVLDDSADITVAASTFSGNEAGSLGGAMYIASNLAGVSTSTFSGNLAGSFGGAIYVAGVVTVSASTFSGNTALDLGGGAIENPGLPG